MSELSARIVDVQFRPVRLREGYDMGEVDEFLEQAAAAAAAGRPLEPLVSAVRFTTVRMREGYDMVDVDTFLAEIAAEPAEGTPPDGSEVDPVTDAEQEQHRLTARITEVRFNPVLRHGYDQGEVDALLDRLGEAAAAGRPLAPLCRAARFSAVRLREGYDQGEVDAFLAELSGDAPNVVAEQRGLLSRMFGRG